MKQQRCWKRGEADTLKDSNAFCVVALGRSPQHDQPAEDGEGHVVSGTEGV